jgi:glycosyltransferase involved in cell wall biosynthesis
LVAARKLTDEKFNFYVKIVGNGPLRAELESLALQLGIADRIQFVGHVEDVSLLLAESAFVVHTADAEGCPNALLEAMASGRAVVATDVGDAPFLVEEGKTGFLGPPRDNEKMVERMRRLISSPDLCCRMGKVAHQRIESEFRLDAMINATVAVYQLAGWRS